MQSPDNPPQTDGHSHVPIKSSPGTGPWVTIAVIVLAIGLGLIAVLGLLSRHRAETQLSTDTDDATAAPPAVEVVHVRRASASTFLTLPGEARALHETTIYARTSGYVKEWSADIGDVVKKGGVMATIETPELDDQLAAARAKVKQAEAEVDLAKANATFAKVSYERWSAAAPEGAVSAQDRDQKKSEMDTSVAKLEASRSLVTVAEAEVQRLMTLSSFKNVVAPFDGTVTQRHVDIGDLVTAGSTTSTTPLYSIARFDQMRVFVDVPQSESPNMKQGMPATVSVGEYKGRAFAGKIARTADAIDPSSRTLRVEVLVDNADGTLKPGMYLDVSFKTDRLAPPLEIPAAALTLRSTGPHVATVSSDGVVRYQPIEIARDLGDVIEVANGISDGQTVAMNISSDVVDGEKVKPHVATFAATSTKKPEPAKPVESAKTAATKEVPVPKPPQIQG